MGQMLIHTRLEGIVVGVSDTENSSYRTVSGPVECEIVGKLHRLTESVATRGRRVKTRCRIHREVHGKRHTLMPAFGADIAQCDYGCGLNLPLDRQVVVVKNRITNAGVQRGAAKSVNGQEASGGGEFHIF